MKECRTCKQVKPTSEFYKAAKGTADGFRGSCKACGTKYAQKWRAANPDKSRLATKTYKQRNAEQTRINARQNRYGITQDEYDRLLDKQYECCAGCGIWMDDPQVDHDHATGKVRGLLCGPCNRGLGLLKDNPDTLKALVKYLEG